MAEKVTIGSAELWHGDCLDVLLDLAAAAPAEGIADAIVTDPPYSSGGFTEQAKRTAKASGLRRTTIADVGWFAGDNMSAAGIAWLLRTVAVLTWPLVKEGGTLSAFTDWRMLCTLTPAIESARWRNQNLVIWDKQAVGLGLGFRAQHECLMHFAKATPVYHATDTGNVIEAGRASASAREHQTQKPLDLMRRVLRVVAPKGGLVVDPFMGSGSTGVAADIALAAFIAGLLVGLPLGALLALMIWRA